MLNISVTSKLAAAHEWVEYDHRHQQLECRVKSLGRNGSRISGKASAGNSRNKGPSSTTLI